MADQIGIEFRNPDINTYRGKSFANTLNLATAGIQLQVIEFLKDVVGRFYGVAHIPSGYGTVTTASVVFDLLANATTGVSVMQVFTSQIAEAESVDSALTAIAEQNITVPATAYALKRVTFNLASAPSADDLILITFSHNGNAAADTLAVNTLIANAYMELT